MPTVKLSPSQREISPLASALARYWRGKAFALSLDQFAAEFIPAHLKNGQAMTDLLTEAGYPQTDISKLYRVLRRDEQAAIEEQG